MRRMIDPKQLGGGQAKEYIHYITLTKGANSTRKDVAYITIFSPKKETYKNLTADKKEILQLFKVGKGFLNCGYSAMQDISGGSPKIKDVFPVVAAYRFTVDAAGFTIEIAAQSLVDNVLKGSLILASFDERSPGDFTITDDEHIAEL